MANKVAGSQEAAAEGEFIKDKIVQRVKEKEEELKSFTNQTKVVKKWVHVHATNTYNPSNVISVSTLLTLLNLLVLLVLLALLISLTLVTLLTLLTYPKSPN